jgi:hypothetical protein
VYTGGFYLKKGFAFTQGNVVSNIDRNGRDPTYRYLPHETLHVWQARAFGPLHLGVYGAWGIGGFIGGSVYWFFNTDKNYGEVLNDWCYQSNPFEAWAYSAHAVK